MKESLTPKQSMLLDYLRWHLSKSDIAPSHDELRVTMGYSNKSSIHSLMRQLEDRGHIKRIPRAHRRITLIEGEK